MNADERRYRILLESAFVCVYERLNGLHAAVVPAATNPMTNDTVTRRFVLTSIAAAPSLAKNPTPFGEAAYRASPMQAHNQVMTALSSFKPRSQEILRSVLDDKGFRGQIGAAAVRELLRSESETIDSLMLSLLPLASTFSRPPLSKYLVGAVVAGSSGNLYLGANIEIPGQSLGLALHAEQAACANAYMSGETGVIATAVTAAPCGHCRQFLNELSLDGNIRVLRKDAPPAQLSTLLPMAFGPKDLGFTQGALPIREAHLSLLTPSSDGQILAALDAARRAYSPYTNSPSGVALRTSDGRLFVGSYIENAAFNPSLPPLQAALAGLFASGQEPAAISKAILVELEGAKISQLSAARATLSSLAPAVRLEVFAAKRDG